MFAELDHGDGPQMVKVPLSDAVWSAWRRYCEVLGLTMGEGIAGLIGVELTALVDDGVDDNSALSVIRAAERLAGREARVAVRERDLETAETRQRERDKRLRRWEGELEAREALLDQASRMVQRRDIHSKIGRNDRCSCGSGLKYKQCHGLLARGANPIPR